MSNDKLSEMLAKLCEVQKLAERDSGRLSRSDEDAIFYAVEKLKDVVRGVYARREVTCS